MKEYELTYRARGSITAKQCTCIVTAKNIKEARANFNEFDNINLTWTILKIERV